jgi:8-oxo-dGTP pyrophosphatase MutT (NUDIX family)
MNDIRIVQVERLDMKFVPREWPFAHERRDEIMCYFAALQRAKPALYNGKILMLHHYAVADGVFRGAFCECDFASFLAWRDWGFPDPAIHNCFGMGVLKSSDGAFVLGVMGPHTVNAGKIYFPGGTAEPGDVIGGSVDMARNMMREFVEETGIDARELDWTLGWYSILDGPRIGQLKIVHAYETADVLRGRILDHIARERQPELAGVHIVRGPADLDPMMPGYVTAFLKYLWR